MYRTLQRLFKHTVQALHQINIKYCEECRRKIMQELITPLTCQFNHISEEKNNFGWCRNCQRFLTRKCFCISSRLNLKGRRTQLRERETDRERGREYTKESRIGHGSSQKKEKMLHRTQKSVGPIHLHLLFALYPKCERIHTVCSYLGRVRTPNK